MAYNKFVYTDPNLPALEPPMPGEAGHFTHHSHLEDKINDFASHVKAQVDAFATNVKLGMDEVLSDETIDARVSAVVATKIGALGVYQTWVPVITAIGQSPVNPTIVPVEDECRYVQVGNFVQGRGMVTVSNTGSGIYKLSLPVTPTSVSVNARRMGEAQLYLGGYSGQFTLEQLTGETLCLAIAYGDNAGTTGGSQSPLGSATITGYVYAHGSGEAKVSWSFAYETA